MGLGGSISFAWLKCTYVIVLLPPCCASIVVSGFETAAALPFEVLRRRDVTFCSAVMNVKHGARACPGDTDTHLTAYRSRYVQLGFAIATSESGPAYTWLASTFAPLFQALVSCLDAAMAW